MVTFSSPVLLEEFLSIIEFVVRVPAFVAILQRLPLTAVDDLYS